MLRDGSRYRISVGEEKLIRVGEELVCFVHDVIRGRRVHHSTVYRWALRGLRGRRLPTVRIGGRLFTSAGAFSWWSEQLALDLTGEVVELPSDAERIEATLRRAGLR